VITALCFVGGAVGVVLLTHYLGRTATDVFYMIVGVLAVVSNAIVGAWGFVALSAIALCAWAYWLKQDLAKRAQRTERSA
jgi:hypothetical protein